MCTALQLFFGANQVLASLVDISIMTPLTFALTVRPPHSLPTLSLTTK
jgi:hypothetical protein